MALRKLIMMSGPIITFLLITIHFSQGHAQGVDYNVAYNGGWEQFESEIGTEFARQTLRQAAEFIWGEFQQQNPSDRKPIRAVSLTIDNQDDGIYTAGDRIHISANYMKNFNGDRRREFAGIIYHESTHVWQWDGQRNAPLWLIEGIADFIRLKAEYIVRNWVERGQGNSWEETYTGATAWFLDYCDRQGGGNFVAQLNARMRNGYNDSFFNELLGKSIPQLWNDYKAANGGQG